MQVGTNYSLSSLLGLTGTTGSAASGTSTSSDSLFGPSAILSIGLGSIGGGGFIGLIAALPTPSTNTSSIPQFDLVSALYPSNSTILETPRSDAEQKADAETLTKVYDDINAGAYDDARSVLDGMLTDNKTNAAAVRALGTLEQTTGNYQKAEQLFLRAHALNPTVGYDKDADNARTLEKDDATVLARARILVASSDRQDDGVRLLIALTDRSPDNTDAHVLLADNLLKQGDGSNGLLQYNVAIRSANTGQLASIEARLKELGQAAPKSAFVQQLIGKTQLRQERYADALTTLQHAADLLGDETGDMSDLAAAYVGVGRQQLATGDMENALASFDQAGTLDPTGTNVKAALAEGYIARAEQSKNRFRYSDALADYRKAADYLGTTGDKDLRAQAAHGAYAVGQTLEQKRIATDGEIDGEVLAYQAAYDLAPDNTTYKRKLADTRNALGNQLLADHEYKDAAASYQRAYELFKNDTTYKTNTINAFIAYGDDRAYNLNYSDAVDAYKSAYSIDATNLVSKQKLAGAYNTRGLDYMDQQKWQLAAQDFKEALRLFPDNTDYQDNYHSVEPWDT